MPLARRLATKGDKQVSKWRKRLRDAKEVVCYVMLTRPELLDRFLHHRKLRSVTHFHQSHLKGDVPHLASSTYLFTLFLASTATSHSIITYGDEGAITPNSWERLHSVTLLK